MNDATQTGVAMAAIGMLGTLAGLLFGYLGNRDKLRYDHELAALKAQNGQQAGQIATLTRTQGECEEKHRECEEKHETLSTRLAQIETQLRE